MKGIQFTNHFICPRGRCLLVTRKRKDSNTWEAQRTINSMTHAPSSTNQRRCREAAQLRRRSFFYPHSTPPYFFLANNPKSFALLGAHSGSNQFPLSLFGLFTCPALIGIQLRLFKTCIGDKMPTSQQRESPNTFIKEGGFRLAVRRKERIWTLGSMGRSRKENLTEYRRQLLLGGHTIRLSSKLFAQERDYYYRAYFSFSHSNYK